MTTDIVERLRVTHAEVVQSDGGECEFIAMFREAADDIERLRAVLLSVRSEINLSRAPKLMAKIEAALGIVPHQQSVERLRNT